MSPDDWISRLPPTQAFGTWDAPMTDDAEWIPVPTDRHCMNCCEQFQDGDNGAIMPTGFAQHRECSLRAVMGGIGHLVDHEHYCHGELGPDAGLSYRESSVLAWQFIAERAPITVADIDARRHRNGNPP